MRKHNFNAGPSILPLPVLEAAQRNLVDHQGLGLSVLEMSHRSPEFEAIVDDARATLGRLLALPDTHEVMFLQGGASLVFALLPLNLGTGGAYVTMGSWGEKAIGEAKLVGPVTELWTDKARNFKGAPTGPLAAPAGAPYVHVTTNETIHGVQWRAELDPGAPLVVDVSSDFLSRPMDLSRFALAYAGAQKNAGPSGVVIVVGKKDVLRAYAGAKTTPKILRFQTHAEAGSLYNTPSTFGIWLCSLVFRWIEEQGGLAAMGARNAEKAKLLYDALDERPELFRGHADRAFRSEMNVTWTMPSPELEARFLAAAEAKGCIGLAGHRSVGGLRASLYNALPRASVEVLADVVRSFAP